MTPNAMFREWIRDVLLKRRNCVIRAYLIAHYTYWTSEREMEMALSRHDAYSAKCFAQANVRMQANGTSGVWDTMRGCMSQRVIV